LPTTILVLSALHRMYRLWAVQRLSAVAIMLAPLLAAILHALYVIRVGGDFMHGRFLLPAFFALTLPVTVVPLSCPNWLRWRFVSWAVASLLWFRVPYAENNEPQRPLISNERGGYIRMAGRPQPVSVADFVPNHSWANDGIWLLEHSASTRQSIRQAEPK